MKVQAHIIAILCGVLLWSVAFAGAHEAYRFARDQGLTPNLGIVKSIKDYV